MKYKVLIVGLGNIAIGYDLFDKDQDCIKTHARAFDMHNSFSLQGGVDCNAKSRKLFEDNYHAPSYTDLDDALVDINPDLVVVSTPTVLHLGNVEVIIKHSSVKVILCEKPLSYHIKEAQEMVRLCSTNKIKLYVNFIRRADPAVIKIKEWIDSRKIGKPIKGVVWYSKGLIHNGSHFIDLLKHWFGPIQSSFIIDNGQKLSQGDVEADFKLNFKDVSMIFTATREEFFSHTNLIAPSNLYWPKLGLTLDEASDFELLKRIIEHFNSKNPLFSCYDVVNFLKKNPELVLINELVVRKES